MVLVRHINDEFSEIDLRRTKYFNRGFAQLIQKKYKTLFRPATVGEIQG
jgi:hypothetical protein